MQFDLSAVRFLSGSDIENIFDSIRGTMTAPECGTCRSYWSLAEVLEEFETWALVHMSTYTVREALTREATEQNPHRTNYHMRDAVSKIGASLWWQDKEASGAENLKTQSAPPPWEPWMMQDAK